MTSVSVWFDKIIHTEVKNCLRMFAVARVLIKYDNADKDKKKVS